MKLKPFALERHFADFEFTSQYMLSSSDAESLTLRELMALDPLATERLMDLKLGYSESQGLPELRAAIAETYEHVSPEQVLTHTGAAEPIFTFMNSVLAPGDHVIVHYPAYQSLYSVAEAIGCEVSYWETKLEKGWELDLDVLRGLLRHNTRVVVINCPHNPTGYLISEKKLKELTELLREKNIILFSDEVYRGVELHGPSLPAACDLYENAVSLGVLSKGYGLAGLRVGWVATRNRSILGQMAAYKDFTSLCNPGVTEHLAVIALKHRSFFLEKTRKIVRTNLSLAADFFREHRDAFDVADPGGGTMIFPRANSLDMDLFAKRLQAEKKVFLISGNYFGMDKTYFRLGLGRKNFPEAFDGFRDFYQSLAFVTPW